MCCPPDLWVCAQADDLRMTFSRAPEHEGHGIVIKIKGTKSLPLTAPPYIALNVSKTSHFWVAAGHAYSSFAVSMAR